MDKFKNYIKLNIGLARKQMVLCLAWFGTTYFSRMLSPENFTGVVFSSWVLIGSIPVIIVYLKLFDEQLFGDGSGLYQALPISAGQTVLAKIVIATGLGVMVLMAMWLGSASAFVFEKYLLGRDVIFVRMSELFGTGIATYFYIGKIVEIFMVAGLILAGVVIRNTFLVDKNSFIGAAIIAATVVLMIAGINKLSSVVRESLAGTNQLLSMVIVVSLNLLVGLVACFIAKRQLETAYVAE